MKVFGIFVSYYPHYAEQSIAEFNTLLQALSADAKLFIACSAQSPLCVYQNSIIYSNEHWEFSGWQEGYEAFNRQNPIPDDALVVFANDTFCLHRTFTRLDRYAFIRAFRRASQSFKGFIVGELCSIPEPVSLLDLTGRQWVSTYLFALDGKTLKQCLPLHFSNTEIDRIITCVTDQNVEFSIATEQHFSHYINSWLYPIEGQKGWRNATGSVQLKKNKLKAILNEKRITFMVQALGGEVFDVYSGRFATYRLWRDRVAKLYRAAQNIMRRVCTARVHAHG
jgi:hypothetical protein